MNKVNDTRNITVSKFIEGYVIFRMWTDKKTNRKKAGENNKIKEWVDSCNN